MCICVSCVTSSFKLFYFHLYYICNPLGGSESPLQQTCKQIIVGGWPEISPDDVLIIAKTVIFTLSITKEVRTVLTIKYVV